ncbi:hypothetical protein LCGC14_0653280 [marine sediment metagenome]|uniref:Calcineurin-like phosphoesterase domain-containing protein n=1 Tax=marine sediment metagenome TaxID=412755 RepID=A0A0F9THD2_9ZZZZ
MSRVLVIGDLHAPVTRKHYLRFCKNQYKKFKCNKVVFIGDVVDWTSISFHVTNPECPGPADEYRLALQCIQQWRRAFPKAMVMIGNHDRRPHRKAEKEGIFPKLLRNYDEVWKTPQWKWVTSCIIDEVYYCHGDGKGAGINPAYNTAKNMGMSVVMGHTHSKAGIKWLVNPLRRWFGMDVGTGIDDSAFAFSYAKEQTYRSILSCGVVLNGMPQHIMMEVGKGERYHDGK